jgi:hypothetical protein
MRVPCADDFPIGSALAAVEAAYCTLRNADQAGELGGAHPSQRAQPV